MSVTISINKHNELINTMKLLETQVEEMLKISSDSLLVWHKNEVNDWLDFLMNHTDVEVLQSLEKEINNRYIYKYNVRIEPHNLDNERLETFEKLIQQFHTMLH
ncbi:hypothetical protein [Paenibacillus sp. NPDC058071]|uniref:hypothetical protein n=1 Tax=Paenibacillus sp. NPDC058071 TaxID=3346326 RepID=UPI0036DAB789